MDPKYLSNGLLNKVGKDRFHIIAQFAGVIQIAVIAAFLMMFLNPTNSLVLAVAITYVINLGRDRAELLETRIEVGKFIKDVGIMSEGISTACDKIQESIDRSHGVSKEKEN